MSKKILVVDDTTDTRDLLHMYLTTAGYTVFMAADGGEGLYQAKMDEPDLIITDISMPNLDGFSMIRQLRANEQFANLPIIALTAYARTEDRMRALRADYQSHISKPVELAELLTVMASLVKRDDDR